MGRFNDRSDGCFKLKETKVWFDFRKTTNDWALSQGCDYEIAGCNNEIRFVKLKKTVVYIAVDEDSNGAAVFEKFKISHLTHYCRFFIRSDGFFYPPRP